MSIFKKKEVPPDVGPRARDGSNVTMEMVDKFRRIAMSRARSDGADSQDTSDDSR